MALIRARWTLVFALAALPGCNLLFPGIPSVPDAAIPDAAPPDTSSRDAAADDDGGPLTTDDEAAIREAEQLLAVYTDGGTADLDGDGTIDVTVTLDTDGTTHAVGQGPHGDLWTIVTHPNGDTDMVADDDHDGTMDIRTVTTVRAAGSTAVTTLDANFDGAPDRRVTIDSDTRGSAATTRHVLEEGWLRPLAGGARTWVAVADWSTDLGDYQLSEGPWVGCAPTFSPHPSTGPGCFWEPEDTVAPMYSDQVQSTLPMVVEGGHFRTTVTGLLACDVGHRTRLTRAVLRSIRDIRALQDINPQRTNGILHGIAHSHVIFACGALPACTGGANAIALSVHPFGDMRSGAITQISESVFAQGDDKLEEITLHELIHDSGSPHVHDESGDGQRDWIYACSRYATHFRAGRRYYDGNPDDASSSRDAALCADFADKHRFGTSSASINALVDQSAVDTMPGDQMIVPTCATSVSTEPTEPATCAIEHTFTYCDQTPAAAADTPAFAVDSYVCNINCPTDAPVGLYCSALTPVPVADPYLHRVGGCLPLAGAEY